MKQKNAHPAIYYQEKLNKLVEGIRNKLIYLKSTLPLKAQELTRNYFGFIDDKRELVNTPSSKLIFRPLIFLALCGLYVIDQAILSDVYDYIAQFLGQDLGNGYRRVMKLAFPLVVICMYLMGIEAHSYIRRKYKDERKAFQASQNPLLNIPLKPPSIPFSLILTGILKYCFPLFIVLIAFASAMMMGNTAGTLLSSALYWIAFFSHLILIFFGEPAMHTVKVALAKKQYQGYWKKRNGFEEQKIRTMTEITHTSEEWYGVRQTAVSQFPENLHYLFRDKFRRDERSTLSRVSSFGFDGVEPDEDKPLFPDWEKAGQKDKPADNEKNTFTNADSTYIEQKDNSSGLNETWNGNRQEALTEKPVPETSGADAGLPAQQEPAQYNDADSTGNIIEVPKVEKTV